MTYVREESVESHLCAEWKRRMGKGARCNKARVANLKGWPDRECLARHGVLVFFETKAPQGRLSAAQKRRHAELRALGFMVFVPYTKAQVDSAITEFQRLRDEAEAQ